MGTTGVPQRCADKVRELMKAGKDIPPPPKQKQFITEPSIRAELRPYTSWRGWAISLLTGALPPAHTYLVEFVNRTEYDDKECPLDRSIESGLGALEDDLEHGYLVGLRTLIPKSSATSSRW
jgi:hypothetical protein